MTFLAPWFLAGGAAAVGAMVALHFLAVDRPRAVPLPTARFVPADPHRSAAWARAPRDRVLLALRALALFLAAAGLARPVPSPERRGRVAVVAVDRSRGTDGPAPSATAVLAGARAGAVVAFDTTARRVPVGALDSVLAAPATAAPGSLSAGLAAAVAAGAALRARHDSVELVIVSPFLDDAFDAATLGIRAAWGGPVRVVRRGAAAPPPAMSVAVRAAAGDPVGVAIARAGLRTTAGRVRVVRDVVTGDDQAFAREGGALVAWPVRADSAPVVTAVVADGIAAVGRFAVGTVEPAGRPIAWWVDGRPAAFEVPTGAGCIRRVGIGVPAASGAAQDAAFHAVVRAVVAPCGGTRGPPAPAARVEALMAATGATAPISTPDDGWGRWLLVLAGALMATEPFVRSRFA